MILTFEVPQPPELKTIEVDVPCYLKHDSCFYCIKNETRYVKVWVSLQKNNATVVTWDNEEKEIVKILQSGKAITQEDFDDAIHEAMNIILNNKA